MAKHGEVVYEKDSDIFFVHNGFNEGEEFKGNIDVGNIVLDMTTKGRICGLEIINASEFFSQFDIDKTILNELSDAKLTSTNKSNSIMLNLMLRTKNKEIPAKIAVPIISSS